MKAILEIVWLVFYMTVVGYSLSQGMQAVSIVFGLVTVLALGIKYKELEK
jgi:tetrahydromethanopterin S-methyltransferase subunit E